MSASPSDRRLTLPDLGARKGRGRLVGLTASSAPMAALLDPFVDLLHVGDALAMVVYGHTDTFDMPLALLEAHARAVVQATRHAFVSVDLPYGAAQASPQEAFRVAAHLLKRTGAGAVKLEGGQAMADTVAFLNERGIPVISHLGLMPQHLHLLGGFRAQGLNADSARRIQADARAVVKAGAVALLLEAVAEPVARGLATRHPVPVLGIGASPACDGQILVAEDLLGLTPEPLPRFAPRYAHLGDLIQDAARRFSEDVRSGAFPEARHCYGTRPATKKKPPIPRLCPLSNPSLPDDGAGVGHLAVGFPDAP